jgi:hypothetical protein
MYTMFGIFLFHFVGLDYRDTYRHWAAQSIPGCPVSPLQQTYPFRLPTAVSWYTNTSILIIFVPFLDVPPLYWSLSSQSRQSAKRFSSRWNWDSPTPLAAGECAPPPYGRGGGQTRLRLKGWGSPNSNEGTYTVVLYIYKYFVS